MMLWVFKFEVFYCLKIDTPLNFTMFFDFKAAGVKTAEVFAVFHFTDEFSAVFYVKS
jgi:hypothetical protein